MNFDEIRQLWRQFSSMWLYTDPGYHRIIVTLEISFNLLTFWQGVWDVKDESWCWIFALYHFVLESTWIVATLKLSNICIQDVIERWCLAISYRASYLKEWQKIKSSLEHPDLLSHFSSLDLWHCFGMPLLHLIIFSSEYYVSIASIVK